MARIRKTVLRGKHDHAVAPGTGFRPHPHQEMEIVTIVLEGELTHQDSMLNKTVIKCKKTLMVGMIKRAHRVLSDQL